MTKVTISSKILFMDEYRENLLKAKNHLGSFDALGKVCGGISGKAIMKWRDKGCPPRTEYTGETCYAKLIHNATNGLVKECDLLPEFKTM